MCTWEIENNWNEIQKQLNRHDELMISSFLSLYDNESSVREKLEFCKNMEISINLKGTLLHEDIYMDVVQLLLKDEEERKQKLKQAQRKGIEKTLAMNKRGKGNKYGRPRADLPVNFEEQIRYCKVNKLSLERYRKNTGLKKSTFYKYAKTIE